MALDADSVLDCLASCPRNFLSLRAAARALDLSTQPLRDWVKRGHLTRYGQPPRFSRAELIEFVRYLQRRAQPFDPDNYLRRLHQGRLQPSSFGKLHSARFVWPKGCKALTPKQLAPLIGCHPSLIVKAICAHEVRGRRRTPCRWEITHRNWRMAFP